MTTSWCSSTANNSSGPEISQRCPNSQTKITISGHSIRLASRSRNLTSPTAGLAPGHIQANLLVLPSRYAADFRRLCQRNPTPCPLLAESSATGSYSEVKSWLPGFSGGDIAADLDIRTDFPKYNVYRDGVIISQTDPGSGFGPHDPAATDSHADTDVCKYWTDDHVAFLIGCSYSFESELARHGLTPPHVLHARNVAMYRTSLPLCPSGVFEGSTYVVSMRAYRRRDIKRVREITRAYVVTHGEPIAWDWEGGEKLLGLREEDLAQPHWGDAPVTEEGKLLRKGMGMDNHGDGDCGDGDEFVPVFWACGVTPQEAVIQARLPGIVMAHAPGHMLVLDLEDEDII